MKVGPEALAPLASAVFREAAAVGSWRFLPKRLEKAPREELRPERDGREAGRGGQRRPGRRELCSPRLRLPSRLRKGQATGRKSRVVLRFGSLRKAGVEAAGQVGFTG